MSKDHHTDRVAIVHNIPIHYSHLLFVELKRRGLDLFVIYSAGKSTARIEMPSLSYDSYPYHIAFKGALEHLPVLKTFIAVWRTLNKVAPKLVLIDGWGDAGAWAARIWIWIHRRPGILWSETNAYDVHRTPWKEAIKRWFVKGFSAAHVYGSDNKKYLVSLGMDPHKIETKRAILNTTLFRPMPDSFSPENKPLVLLYVGRLTPAKNLDFLLRSFAQVHQNHDCPRLVLALVGYGKLERSLQELASDLGLGDTVQFWGPAKQQELPLIYARSDAFILPSKIEAWGLVALEAMCCARPVLISNRCGCAADLVTPDTGWAFSPFDAEALTRLLDSVSHMSRQQLRKMGNAAMLLASEYDPQRGAERVLSTIDYGTHATYRSLGYGVQS